MNQELLQINPDLEFLFEEYGLPSHLGDHFLAVYLLEDTDESEKEELIEIFLGWEILICLKIKFQHKFHSLMQKIK